MRLHTRYPPILINWKKVLGIFCKAIKIKSLQKESHVHKYLQPLPWHSKLSSGASCFHWSSLRCFYNLIGVYLWWIQLIGHDLERHTPVYIRSHSWQCMSEHKPSHEVQWVVCRPLRQDCNEAKIWWRVQKHFCSIEGPNKNPMVTDRAPGLLCEERRTFQKDNHLCSTPPIRPVW